MYVDKNGLMAPDEDSSEEDPDRPSHYTRESWLTIPISGAVGLVLGVVMCIKLRDDAKMAWMSIPIGGILGTLGATALVVRSHIHSKVWSEVILFGGLFLIAAIVCAALIFLAP